jgi:SAM-dependent methyltransferase
MYQIIKKTLYKLFPRKIIVKNESLFRFLYYQLYKGSTYQCNICNKKLCKFITLWNEDKLCPYCGSISRDRRLWHVLKTRVLKTGLSVLDFSPTRCIRRMLEGYNTIQYVTSDFSKESSSPYHFDITDILVNNNSYDVIICYHILEHVENDQKAMKELHRVLKKGGKCIIQTPFKEGKIYENPLVVKPENRLIQFGQSDHVRIYSLDTLKKRLIDAEFKVEVLEFTEPMNNMSGFKTKEFILLAEK